MSKTWGFSNMSEIERRACGSKRHSSDVFQAFPRGELKCADLPFLDFPWLDCDRHFIKINQKETLGVMELNQWSSWSDSVVMSLGTTRRGNYKQHMRAPWPQGRTWLRKRNCGATITSESRVYESRNSCCLFNPPYALWFCMCFSLYSVCVGNRSKMMNERQRWCCVFTAAHYCI